METPKEHRETAPRNGPTPFTEYYSGELKALRTEYGCTLAEAALCLSREQALKNWADRYTPSAASLSQLPRKDYRAICAYVRTERGHDALIAWLPAGYCHPEDRPE